jgi:hypothetical protein
MTHPLQYAGYYFPGKKVGVQLLQFRNDPVGTQRLRRLDEVLPKAHGFTRDICDTTQSHDNVWKVLLECFNGHWDNDIRLSGLSYETDRP